MTSKEYKKFLASKAVQVPSTPVPHGELGSHLFDFQRHIVEWALGRGRAAIFADCGLGKTAMQLEWSRHVAAHTGRPVIILAPLAVAQQTIREGARFGVRVVYATDGASADMNAAVVITNYERLERFDLTLFGGVVLDESSILKSFMGKTKRMIIDSSQSVAYRLACTATPAPNDHLELGNHAEFLGVMQSSDMIARWFINDTSTFGVYRLKGHAVESFWDWVSSWACCIATPADIGFDGSGYELPELVTERHIVEANVTEGANGTLFRIPEMSATSVHAERRRTAAPRAAKVAELVAAEPREQWIVWCDTDYEADAITKALQAAGVESREVRGSHPPERKESSALAFSDGDIRVLVSKPAIFGWGLNWQHVARVAFAGASFSYELRYQAIRRCWRFGQKRAVVVHEVLAETETNVAKVMSRKAEGHDGMREQMRLAAVRAQAREASSGKYHASKVMRCPAWLQSEEGGA